MKKITFGQMMAEKVAANIGSWKFLIIQTIFLTIWVFLNASASIYHWDAYPFILLNLFLSLQAAYTGPLLLIASNRQTEVDRQRIEHNLHLTEAILTICEAQKDIIQKLEQRIEEVVDEVIE